MRKETQIKFCKVMAVSSLLCGSETWLLNQKHYSSLPAAQMAYLRSVQGFMRLDCWRSESVRQELNVIPRNENVDSYRKRWTEHLLGMDGPRIAKIAFEYNPKGRRDVGCSRKRWVLGSRNRPGV